MGHLQFEFGKKLCQIYFFVTLNYDTSNFVSIQYKSKYNWLIAKSTYRAE